MDTKIRKSEQQNIKSTTKYENKEQDKTTKSKINIKTRKYQKKKKV